MATKNVLKTTLKILTCKAIIIAKRVGVKVKFRFVPFVHSIIIKDISLRMLIMETLPNQLSVVVELLAILVLAQSYLKKVLGLKDLNAKLARFI